MGGWVGARAGVNAVEKRKSPPCREWNPGPPDRSISPYKLKYPASKLNMDRKK
jgi:hypothetical protein